MRNTRKTLIISVLLAELAVGAYLLLHKGDDTTDMHATQDGLSQEEASDPMFRELHVTAGSIAGNAGTVAATGNTGDAAIAPAQSTTEAFVAPVPFAPPVQNAAPATQAVPKGNAGLAPAQSVANTVSASDASMLERRPTSAARTETSRESSRGRGSRAVTSAITDELVRESAQLDPSLPPPPAPPVTAPSTPAPIVRTDASRRTNPVAAAMTDSLVRDSARLDPSLPPPKSSGSQ